MKKLENIFRIAEERPPRWIALRPILIDPLEITCIRWVPAANTFPPSPESAYCVLRLSCGTEICIKYRTLDECAEALGLEVD